MNIQRGTIKGLSMLAILATAGGAAAQEQWVAPQGQAPAEAAQTGQTVTTTVTETDLTMPPPIAPTYTSGADVGTSQGASKLDHYMAPVRRAFEIQLGGGYGQGLGEVAKGEGTLSNFSGPGATLQLTLGYRAAPGFMIGIYGTGSQFARTGVYESGTDLRSGTAGLQADFHFRPSFTIDPWLSVASGVRGYWITPDVGENTKQYGWQIARVQLGADFRVTREVAVAPVIGGDVSMFFTREGPGTNGFDNIHDPRANFFLFGGLQARFDMGSRKSSASTATTYGSGPSSSF